MPKILTSQSQQIGGLVPPALPATRMTEDMVGMNIFLSPNQVHNLKPYYALFCLELSKTLHATVDCYSDLDLLK